MQGLTHTYKYISFPRIIFKDDRNVVNQVAYTCIYSPTGDPHESMQNSLHGFCKLSEFIIGMLFQIFQEFLNFVGFHSKL